MVERHEVEERMGGNSLAEAANDATMEIGKLSEGTAAQHEKMVAATLLCGKAARGTTRLSCMGKAVMG